MRRRRSGIIPPVVQGSTDALMAEITRSTDGALGNWDAKLPSSEGLFISLAAMGD